MFASACCLRLLLRNIQRAPDSAVEASKRIDEMNLLKLTQLDSKTIKRDYDARKSITVESRLWMRRKINVADQEVGIFRLVHDAQISLADGDGTKSRKTRRLSRDAKWKSRLSADVRSLGFVYERVRRNQPLVGIEEFYENLRNIFPDRVSLNLVPPFRNEAKSKNLSNWL
jgi:hypothetical protein